MGSFSRTNVCLEQFSVILCKFYIEGFSGKKRAQKLLTHTLFEKVVDPGTTSRLISEENVYFLVSEEHT